MLDFLLRIRWPGVRGYFSAGNSRFYIRNSRIGYAKIS